MTDTPTENQDAEVKGGVVAYVQVDGANRAAAFYQRAFGATLVAAVPEDDKGRTMHVHLHINGSSVMLCDCYPEHDHPAATPQAFNLMMTVEDIDAWWRRAVDAGAAIVLPVSEMFWGARYGQLRDPFGVVWALNQPIR